MAYEFRILSLIPNGMVLGWQVYSYTEEYNFNEINLYLIIIQLQFRWVNT